jgi:hypothetical protein
MIIATAFASSEEPYWYIAISAPTTAVAPTLEGGFARASTRELKLFFYFDLVLLRHEYIAAISCTR